jgi:hypothetical protein
VVARKATRNDPPESAVWPVAAKPVEFGTQHVHVKPVFYLDPARIRALEIETAQVAILLGNVFREDGERMEPEVEALSSSVSVDNTLLGLDPEHAAFLRVLVTRTSWPRHELEDAAADMELMLDGALERINEAALDQFDEPLIEGEDPLEVLLGTLEKLSA